MSTTNELLESLERAVDETEVVVYSIDPDTRLIDIPRDFFLGVESDERVHRVYFTCPKIVGDDIDLTELQLRVNYQNANGKKLYDDIDDVTESTSIPGNVIFSWLLSREVTECRGDVTFTICAVLRNEFEITNEWNTIPTTGRVEKGLEPDSDSKNKHDFYLGSYQVVPKANEEQILETKNRIMTDNVTILEIPYYEVSNDSNGTTVYIAKEV